MIRSLIIFCLVVILIPFHKIYASHISGGEITTRCISSSQVEITVKLYWDCNAFATMPTSIFFDLSSTCGSQSYMLPLINVNGTEVSNLCSKDLQNSSCNGGPLPGRKEYVYQDIISVSAGCDPYVASYYDCCRDYTTNIANSNLSGFYLESVFSTSTSNCNQAPVFKTAPIPYFCVNQAASFNYAASEPDGDSLVYSLVDALDFGSPLLYNSGYSGIEPIPGIAIDAQTAQIDFMPTNIGNYIVVVKVEEYDKKTGLLLSVINRDIQFVIIACNNNVPDISSSGFISNLSPNAILSGTNTVLVCEGESISFDLSYMDPDVNDTLRLNTNLITLLPTAILDTNGVNPLIANIKWAVPIGSAGKNNSFTVNVHDNACPVVGSQSFVYHINIIDKASAGPDQVICQNAKAKLHASGGSVFTWKSISGDPISASNFSCNSCSDPIASPSVTTTYEVVSNLTGACKLKDTVVVKLVPDFTYSMIKSTSNACLTQNIQLNVSVSPIGAYAYQWTGNALFSNASAPSTKVSFNESGYNYAYINLKSLGGCEKIDSIGVNVFTVISPDVSLITSDSVICAGDTIVLRAKINSVFPASCGLAMVSCNPLAIDTFQVGKDIKKNSATSYPAPYGNYSKTGRHQFLFTASELRAAGVKSKIASISFFVSQNSGNTIYDDFTVRMACTGMSGYYSSNWEGGLQDVVFPRQIVLQNGWNQHLFDSEYEWDGISNLVIEVCFDNTSSAVSLNAISPFTLTSFPSVLYYVSSTNQACSFIGTANVSYNRPNILFTACSDAVKPSDYNYTWNAPISSLALPSIKIAPYATAIYSITVSDKGNLCKTTETVRVRTLRPQLSFTTNPDSGMAPLLVDFANTSISNLTSFAWNFGDGSNSTVENPSHTFVVPGKYPVSFAGMSTDGCRDTIKKEIIVKNVIPNIITPNGDNINDVFSVKIENLKSYKAKILNRWGVIVFEWNDPNASWSASDVPSGVYYYLIEGVQNDGSLIKFHGNITVLK